MAQDFLRDPKHQVQTLLSTALGFPGQADLPPILAPPLSWNRPVGVIPFGCFSDTGPGMITGGQGCALPPRALP